MSEDRRPRRDRDAWAEVDTMRSSWLAYTSAQTIGPGTWRGALRRIRGRHAATDLGSPESAPVRVFLIAGGILALAFVGLLTFAILMSGLRATVELALIVLYFTVAIIAIPLAVMLAVFLAQLPGRGFRALRRR